MSEPAKPGGYTWKQEVNRGISSNQAAQEALRRLIEEQPRPQVAASLQLDLSLALATNLSALMALQQIDARAAAQRDQLVTPQEARRLLCMMRLRLPEDPLDLLSLNARTPVGEIHRRP